MATREQAYQECLTHTNNALATQVLIDKYFMCVDNDYKETNLKQMWSRLAKTIVRAEIRDKDIYEKRFYNSLENFKFVPGGRILYGLGLEGMNVTLKNCYVIAIKEDSIKGVFQTAYEMAETLKHGGGCGINISPLRPRGSIVHNAAKCSSGAVSFMNFFSHITGMIGQNARIGALIICLDVDHPDIEDFILIKGSDLELVRFANISILMTDKFMMAVEKNKNFDLQFNNIVYKTIKARELWKKIIHYAWKRAEPGLLFWDNIIKESIPDNYERFNTVATNPCAESPLSHGDSCNLGSINLGKYVVDSFEKSAKFDFNAMDQDIRCGIRFLDDIITLEKCPFEFQQWANDNGRRLGLGVMGLADVFLRMRIKYNTDQALLLAEEIIKKFRDTSYDESCELAKEKGPFPVFNVKRHFKSPFIQRLPLLIQKKIKKYGIRNISLHAIAPTGSLQCIAQCSGSIEPVYEMQYYRSTNLGTAKETKKHLIIHSVAQEYMDKYSCKFEDLPDLIFLWVSL